MKCTSEIQRKGRPSGSVHRLPGVGNKLEHFDKALENLRAEGFRSRNPHLSGKTRLFPHLRKRAKEFKEMFTDPEVDFVYARPAVISLMEMLPYTDFEAVVKNPKWFMGMSDPSTLLFILPRNTTSRPCTERMSAVSTAIRSAAAGTAQQ